MFGLFDSINDLLESKEVVRRRRYGVIEVVGSELISVSFRPWPKMISVAEIGWFGAAAHRKKEADRCVLYYNQPIQSSNYLALKYVVSNHGTSYKTFRKCLVVFDQIAWIKRTDALVCEASNLRISDRFMKRQGWERHMESSSRRHYIKRFYGEYPEHAVLEEPGPLKDVA